MKKVLALVLALAMILSACAVLAEEPVSQPQPEGGKKFETNWAIFDMTVEIVYEEEGYRVYIKHEDPFEHKGEEYEYSCYYVEDRDALVSIFSSKNTITIDPVSGDITRGEFEYQDMDGEGQATVFTINKEGRLEWQDGRGGAGADLEFTDIGKFEGVWRSEDKKTFAEIEWNDSEIDDEYGYNVFLHDEGDESYAEYSTHGLYDPETKKLTVTGSVIIYRLNAEGKYDMEEIKENPDDPLELIFSSLGDGKILLERDNGIELIYDIMGSDSHG